MKHPQTSHTNHRIIEMSDNSIIDILQQVYWTQRATDFVNFAGEEKCAGYLVCPGLVVRKLA